MTPSIVIKDHDIRMHGKSKAQWQEPIVNTHLILRGEADYVTLGKPILNGGTLNLSSLHLVQREQNREGNVMRGRVLKTASLM